MSPHIRVLFVLLTVAGLGMGRGRAQPSPVQFKVDIAITAGAFSQHVTIGVYGDGPNPPGVLDDNTAGMDIDPGFGEYRESPAPPVPPPPYSLDVRLVTVPGRVSTYPVGLNGGVLSDFRGYVNAAQVDSFKIVISGDATDSDTTRISWPDNLSQYGSSWTITPQAGESWPMKDMLATSSVSIPPGALKNVIIVRNASVMNARWNLVSAHRAATDSTAHALFPGALPNTIYSYRTGSYTKPGSLTRGEGYWAFYTSACTNSIEGSDFPNVSVAVPEGYRWVLIGSVTSAVSSSHLTSDPPGCIIARSLHGFDGLAYHEPATLLPGRGYWVLVNAPCTLTIAE